MDVLALGSLCWLTDLSVTCGLILLYGNGALVAENDIVKCIAGIDDTLYVLQPLRFVCLSDHLAVLGAL